MVQKRSTAPAASTNESKQKKAKNAPPGVPVEGLLLAELLDQPKRKTGPGRPPAKRSAPAPEGVPVPRRAPREAAAEAQPAEAAARERKAPAARLSEVVVGYDPTEEPTPIRLVARGKELAQGEVFETQSDEIRKEYPQSPIAKACRAKYNWVAQTEGGRFTRDPNKMLPMVRAFASGKWTCDVCGKNCSEQLFVFRAFLRREHLRESLEGRTLDPFVAYISFKCGRGLLGQLSEYTRFREEVFSLTTKHNDLDQARQQLEEALKRCNREDQQFLMDELERLAGVGPNGAPKTVEMDSVERLVPGPHPAVLLRSAEDVFRAMARTLAPRVGARVLAAATLQQLQEEGVEVTGYLQSVRSSLDAGGPLPQAPPRWPLAQVELALQAALRAINGQGERPQLRVELACSWEAKMKAFGPQRADLTLRLGYLQARQALHAFVPQTRLQREDAALLQQRLEGMSGELQPVQGGLAPSLPGMSLRPAPRFMGRAESLGYGWHSADWARRLKDLLHVEMDFSQRPLRLATGCSGAEAPHFALQQLVGHEGFEQLWGSEINENPRRFILKNCACKHLFEDVCYIMEGGGRCARHGGHCSVPQGEVDIFVGGFPCTPYSFCNPKRFKRNCFTEPAAVPFFEMRKFIAERRPRLVILENVRGLLAPNPETDHPPIDFILRGKNPENPEDCYQGTSPNADWGLSLIKGYGLRWDILYSCDWGLPQSRPRVYIVMVRDDAGGQAAAERIFEVIMSCAGRMPRGSCNDFLLADDDPKLVESLRKAAIKPEQKTGPGGRRACTKFTEALFRTKRQELGLDPKDRPYSGKRPPGWYPQATEKMVQQLDIIHAIGEKQGLDFNFLLADLSQQVSRGAWRDDGNIPTLTTGSLLYSFSRHRPFLGQECLRLNGFPIEQLNLDAHTEAERIFLAGNAMSVPVVGAVLFAALVSLDWGDGRQVQRFGADPWAALPEPLQMRPDVRKLTQPAGVVLAQLAPSLMDDECEVVAPPEDAKSTEDSALARRAAVLLALTKELTKSGAAAKRKEGKEGKDKEPQDKSNGLLAAVQASGPPLPEADGQGPASRSAAGDGGFANGWKGRQEKVLERLKAPSDEAPLSNVQLKTWLAEATHLLQGMDRDERHNSASELQHFVVKSLQVFSDAETMGDLGLEDVLSKLCHLRFPEAKSLFGRLTAQKLQKDFSSKDFVPQEIDWQGKAQQLTGGELSGARAQLLKQLIRQGRHKLGRFFVPLLQLWHKEEAEDQELQQVQKGVEILFKVWTTGEPEDIWSGFFSVCRLRQCCLEIAKNCEGRRRPKSSQAFYDLAQRLLQEVFLSRAALALKSTNRLVQLRNFMRDVGRAEEYMGWSSTAAMQPIWNVMCFLGEFLKDVDEKGLEFILPPEKEMCAVMGYNFMAARAGLGANLLNQVDHFLCSLLPSVAMRLHLYEFLHCQQQGKPVEDAKQRSRATLETFLNWCHSRLSRLTFDFKGWASTTQLEERLTDQSSQMNVIQKCLTFAYGEMTNVAAEHEELWLKCVHLIRQSQPYIQAQGMCQEALAKLSIIEHHLTKNMSHGILQSQEIRQGLVELLELDAAQEKDISQEQVQRCLEQHHAKAPDEVIEDILRALKVKLRVPALWKRNVSSVGLYFFQYQNCEATSWIWPITDVVEDVVQDMQDMQDLAGAMTPPEPEETSDLELTVPPATPHLVPNTVPPRGLPPRVEVPVTPSGSRKPSVVRPSSGAFFREEPALVPSSPDESDDLIMSITPPADCQPGDSRPAEPRGPPPADPRPAEPQQPPPADPRPAEPQGPPPADPRPAEPQGPPPADPRPAEPQGPLPVPEPKGPPPMSILPPPPAPAILPAALSILPPPPPPSTYQPGASRPKSPTRPPGRLIPPKFGKLLTPTILKVEAKVPEPKMPKPPSQPPPEHLLHDGWKDS